MKDRPPATRHAIGEGIYRDAYGISVIARIGSGANLRQSPPQRFPLHDADGIPYSKKNNSELIKCRLRLLEDLRRQRATEGRVSETLGAAIDAFLKDRPVTKGTDSRKHDDYRYLLAHWRTSPLAAIPVAALPRKLIREQLRAWTDAGSAPSTVNSRRQALAAVLRVALAESDDDDVVILPTDKIPYVRPRELQARGIEIPILLRIIATLPDHGRATKGQKRPRVNLTKVRLRVMAWTGLAHMSLTRLERRFVNFREGRIYLPPRKKGKGVAGVWVDALPQAIDALRAYDAAGLWRQSFSRSSMWKCWQRAVKNARGALEREAEKTGDRTMLDHFLICVPERCRPYDVRHSFLTDVLRKTGDMRATQELAQHRDIKTTERYTKGAVPERVATAIAKMRTIWFPDAPKPPGVVRDFQMLPKTGV